MELLPKEILVEIFSYLPYKDLKSILTVSKKFFDAGTERRLWKHFKLFVTRRNINKLEKILKLAILQDLKDIVFKGCDLDNTKARILMKSQIKMLQLGSDHEIENDCGIRKVSPWILSELIEKIEVLKYQNSLFSELNEKQTTHIISTINRGGANLKNLEMFYNNSLTLITPDSLATALTSLTHLTLGENIIPYVRNGNFFPKKFIGKGKYRIMPEASKN